jgi:2-oxoglutarate ferredoxin oxidoreductase, beta subunit (EC 1.2.7.3)
VARWTILQTRDLTTAINEAIMRKGFSFIEVLSPCPVNYGRRNKEKPIDTSSSTRTGPSSRTARTRPGQTSTSAAAWSSASCRCGPLHL